MVMSKECNGRLPYFPIVILYIKTGERKKITNPSELPGGKYTILKVNAGQDSIRDFYPKQR